MGLIGLVLSRKLGIPDLLDDRISHKHGFIVPALIGVVLGIFFSVIDPLASHLHPLGTLRHPSFPTSLISSATAGIGEEIIFRLFFISRWVWLISYMVLKQRGQDVVFWAIPTLSAAAFAFGHLPAVIILHGLTEVSQIPPAMLGEILLLIGALSFLAASFWKKYGFLAAVGVHFWTEVVWHVIWGAFSVSVFS